MGNVQGQSDDESTVALRVVSQGFVDLHLAVRAGEIVDPFTLPERLGQGMEMISRLCLLGQAEDIASSVHGLSDIVRRLPVGEWGVPSFRSPFPFAEARLLTPEPVAPTGMSRAHRADAALMILRRYCTGSHAGWAAPRGRAPRRDCACQTSLQGSEIEPGRPNGDGARLAASFICVTRSNRLPTGQMILDIVGDLLADGRQLKHLVFDDGIVGPLGKLPIHHRLVA